MGSSYSHRFIVPPEDYVDLKKLTRFTRGEIQYLYTRFRELCHPARRKRYIVRTDFDFGFYALHSLLLNAMFGDKYRINFVEFCVFLNTFKPLNLKATEAQHLALRTKKLKLLFSMYDIGKNGEITKRDLLEIVYRLYSDYSNIHTMVQIVNVAMKEMDPANSNKILYDHFAKTLENVDMELIAINFPTL